MIKTISIVLLLIIICIQTYYYQNKIRSQSYPLVEILNTSDSNHYYNKFIQLENKFEKTIFGVTSLFPNDIPTYCYYLIFFNNNFNSSNTEYFLNSKSLCEFLKEHSSVFSSKRIALNYEEFECGAEKGYIKNINELLNNYTINQISSLNMEYVVYSGNIKNMPVSKFLNLTK